jgi:hypothetical protein
VRGAQVVLGPELTINPPGPEGQGGAALSPPNRELVGFLAGCYAAITVINITMRHVSYLWVVYGGAG